MSNEARCEKCITGEHHACKVGFCFCFSCREVSGFSKPEPDDALADQAVWDAIYAFNLIHPWPHHEDAATHYKAMKAALAAAALRAVSQSTLTDAEIGALKVALLDDEWVQDEVGDTLRALVARLDTPHSTRI